MLGVVQDHVVARELHTDGNFHLHAWVRYVSRLTLTPTTFDLDLSGTKYHGNYQLAKSPTAVTKYCSKGGDFIASMDLEAKSKKKAARNKELLDTPINELVDSGSLGLLQAPALQRSIIVYKQSLPPTTTESVRGVWLVGKPGVGKTHSVTTREPSLYKKSQNKWWDNYQGETAVLLDDFDTMGTGLSHLLKIWADKWAATGEVKGATVNLRYTTFYVTSNYTIEELWPGEANEELREALLRRFKVHRITARGDPFN